MNKICVYTCITGDYENLKEIEKKESGIDYYCFTNNRNIKSNTWNIVYIESDELSNVELARKTKILGHGIINNYDIQLWMDGAIIFNESILKFINHYLNDDDVFVAFSHGERNNIKEEAYACVRARKEKKEKVKKLLKFYEDSGYKYDNGLIESTVFIKRPKDKKVQETCSIWFDMIVNFSHRDQLSFNYCLWKTGLKVKWIKEKVFHNNWFEFKSHNLAKNIESYRVYFNDINDSSYNMENDFQGSFIKQDNEYCIELIVPCDTKKTVIELSKVPFLKLNYFKINGKSTENVHYFNSFLYKNSMFFYNQNGAFEIYDYLKKGETLKVNMDLEIVKQEELVNIFKYQEDLHNELLKKNNEMIKKEQDEIDKLKFNNEKLRKNLNEILNSKSWKFIRSFDKIRKNKEKK